MNYDQELAELSAALKADKIIIQPWRNYAMKALNEAQAFIRMGKTSSNLTAPAGLPQTTSGCTCLLGARDKNCPIHGDR